MGRALVRPNVSTATVDINDVQRIVRFGHRLLMEACYLSLGIGKGESDRTSLLRLVSTMIKGAKKRCTAMQQCAVRRDGKAVHVRKRRRILLSAQPECTAPSLPTATQTRWSATKIVLIVILVLV